VLSGFCETLSLFPKKIQKKEKKEKERKEKTKNK